MESLSYVNEGVSIFLGIISLGITLRCIKVIIDEGVIKGEWLRALLSLRVKIFALICATSLMGSLMYIRKVYRESADSYVEDSTYDDDKSTIHTSPGGQSHGGGGAGF